MVLKVTSQASRTVSEGPVKELTRNLMFQSSLVLGFWNLGAASDAVNVAFLGRLAAFSGYVAEAPDEVWDL